MGTTTTPHRPDTAGGVIRAFLIAVLVFHHPATTAVIVVDGSCSLPDAVTAANSDAAVGGCSAGSGADQIQLTVDATLTAPLPAITSEIDILGSGHAIERDAGTPSFGLFSVAGQTLGIHDATLRNGRAANGGAVYADDYAQVTLHDVRLSGNQATDSGGAVLLEDGSSLVMVDSVLTNNTAGHNGGAIFGGYYSSVTIERSSFYDNQASDDGGAVYVGWGSQTTLLESTLSRNSASFGAGVFSGFYSVTEVFNSTVSGNDATFTGGGFFNGVGYGDVALLNSTVLRNTGSNIYAGFESGTFTIEGSIVAYPMTGSNCDGYAYFVSGPTTFDDDGSCPGSSPITPGVDFETALADNGGPTLTHALLAGSVAVDAAGVCGLATDQRGFDRTDGACDSGSVEFGAAPVSGRVAGVQAQQVQCANLSTGQQVPIVAVSDETWDCEAAGLLVSPGDRVRQTVRAKGDGGASGLVFGVDAKQLECRNLTTGLTVRKPLSTHSWDCVAEGLVVSLGDRILQTVTGLAR